jgi:hypothetical protein
MSLNVVWGLEDVLEPVSPPTEIFWNSAWLM